VWRTIKLMLSGKGVTFPVPTYHTSGVTETFKSSACFDNSVTRSELSHPRDALAGSPRGILSGSTPVIQPMDYHRLDQSPLKREDAIVGDPSIGQVQHLQRGRSIQTPEAVVTDPCVVEIQHVKAG
jgi:hypothetical protein